ncbi:hypothetical protein JHD46_07830 [Sulfurimonas sp. SAG-AH-194-C20]|nr:hypothetical protein [Sulfurimonas sp. SAG-AH-194-C20]
MTVTKTLIRNRMGAIVTACRENGITQVAQIQYVVATALWETGFTLLPVKEAYWVKNWKHYIRYSAVTSRYFPYYGRGYVQITWLKNYKVFSKLLGIDLVKNPDLALQSDIAMKILVIGMRDGLFTGVGLDRYINEDKTNFIEARYIINGRDKRKQIAALASSVNIKTLSYVRY